MEYQSGDLVRHPKRPEWGVGRVIMVDADGKLSISFSKGGSKKLVPQPLEKLSRTTDSVRIYHREFLENQGKAYKGTRSAGKNRHRITHCYSCKSRLDNSVDLECISCSWIICWCGACGCGYGTPENA
ncbi:MAG: DUF3553 domain-containing protein [Acidobacteria bacterium]|nr:DUF3553 domain-containing protein [Acidobacteriota bacterium]